MVTILRRLPYFRFWLLFFLLAIPSGLLHADSKSISLEVKPASGTLEDHFTLSVIIEDRADIALPVLIGGEDFQQGYIGPQNNIFIDGSNVRQTTIHTYRLIPKRTGTLQTPAVEITIGGKKVLFDSLSVSVSEAPAVQYYDRDDVFLRQSVDREVVYLGEQVSNLLEIYQSPFTSLSNMQLMDLTYDGFWHKSVGNDQRFRRMVRGQPYDVIRIRRALYPMQSGELEIPQREMKAKMLVRERRDLPRARDLLDRNPFEQDFFDHFFSPRRMEDILINSNSLNIEVKPLPPLPAHYPDWGMLQPLVGDTSMAIEYPDGEIKLGESKTVSLTITSQGNLAAISGVPLESEATFRLYHDKAEETFTETNNRVTSSKTFRFSLVPLVSGRISLPAIELAYFDPVEERYKIAQTPPISFNVSGTAVDQTVITPPIESETGHTEQQKTTGVETLSYTRKSFIETVTERLSPALLLLLLTATVLFIMFIAFTWKTYRNGSPSRIFLKQLDNASSSSEIYQILRDYIAVAWGPSGSTISSGGIKVQIKQRAANADVQYRMQSIIDKLDSYLFQGIKETEADLKELKEELKSVLPYFK